MRVFITGATGHIGSVVVPELLRGGHEVHGLARSDEGAAGLRALGALAVRGSLSDHDTLAAAAVRADAVLHLALFDTARLRAGDGAGAAAAGIDAVRAMGEALAATGTALVSVSAVARSASSGTSRRSRTRHLPPAPPPSSTRCSGSPTAASRRRSCASRS
ncbi:NAD-dependent epimerase/dehydratase family protein [Amnibacterium endophyticum]|uniref:NAD-dependent epimerase/dehydratase family protein n=1 Tax=Amnibacterium endophyticum TaxID=2109337 RepID=A0ABW4LG10_9MICO